MGMEGQKTSIPKRKAQNGQGGLTRLSLTTVLGISTIREKMMADQLIPYCTTKRIDIFFVSNIDCIPPSVAL